VVGGGEELHLPKRAVPAPAIQTTAAQASAVTATVTVVGIRLIGLLVWVAGSRIWRPLADRRSGWQQSGKQASRHRYDIRYDTVFVTVFVVHVRPASRGWADPAGGVVWSLRSPPASVTPLPVATPSCW
jgi:hypothetical protein